MDQMLQEDRTVAFWRDLFLGWPQERPRRGIIVTAWQETMSFDSYVVSDEVLFLNRPQPDGLGARKIMLPFRQIAAVKFTDVFELDAFASVGFQ